MTSLNTSTWFGFVLACLMPSTWLLAAPADDALKAFRDYVAAVRGGSVEKVLKLVEPVPEASQPLLKSGVESLIAVNAVKTEMTKQMGPPEDVEDEGWNMGQLPDEVLKGIRGEVIDADRVTLKAKDRVAPDHAYEVTTMFKREGKWVVPAATALGLDEPSEFAKLTEEERNDLLKQANALTAAAKAVLDRLRKKEFKTPPEVQEALTRAYVAGLGK